VLINSVFLHANFLLKYYEVPLQIKVLKHIDKYRKHNLWNGGDINKKSGGLVAWKHDCRPKNEGALVLLISKPRIKPFS
jgi:hypothetical protein